MSKFIVTMKTPDALGDACQEAAIEEIDALEGIAEEEVEALTESRADKLIVAASRWFEYGEYLRVEIDTEEMTCVVLPY